MEEFIKCNCCGRELPTTSFPYKPDGSPRKICYKCHNRKCAEKYRENHNVSKPYIPRDHIMTQMEGEEWREVDYANKHFYVSSLGRVGYKRSDGNVYLYACHYDKAGYVKIKKHKGFCGGVHRLVVSAFIGAIPKDMEVNHKNGVKDDNRVENLEIVTPKENVRHSIEVLGKKHLGTLGKTGSLSKLSKPVACYDLDGNFLKRYAGLSEAARQIGVSKTNIYKVCRGILRTSKGFIWRYDE